MLVQTITPYKCCAENIKKLVKIKEFLKKQQDNLSYVMYIVLFQSQCLNYCLNSVFPIILNMYFMQIDIAKKVKVICQI